MIIIVATFLPMLEKVMLREAAKLDLPTPSKASEN